VKRETEREGKVSVPGASTELTANWNHRSVCGGTGSSSKTIQVEKKGMIEGVCEKGRIKEPSCKAYLYVNTIWLHMAFSLPSFSLFMLECDHDENQGNSAQLKMKVSKLL
jgi:hypothetical protein